MLLEATQLWSIDLSRSAMVGDRWRDIGAGKAARCRTYFIDYGYDEDLPIAPDVMVRDLAHAAGLIISVPRPR